MSLSSPPTTQLIEQVILKIFWEPGFASGNIKFLLLINFYCYKLAMQYLSQVLKLPVMVLLLSERHHV